MFDAPEIIKNIPDIKQMYEINEKQGKELDAALMELEDNVFADTMSEQITAKWGKFLKLSKADGDKLEDRRARVKAKILERLPYSYRIIVGKIKGMCNELHEIEIDDERTEIEISALFERESQIRVMEEMLENCLPLNMIYNIRSKKEYEKLGYINIGGIIASKQTKRYVELEEIK